VGPGQPAYYYQFERVIPGREEGGTFHSSEFIYLFGTLGSGWLMRPGVPNFNPNLFDRPLPATEAITYNFQLADHAVAEQMQQYWTTFAKKGDPNNGTLPVWPRVDRSSIKYVGFTEKGPVARNGLRTEFCQLYRSSLTPRRPA
jgi:para-nitrobenzyl esterase